MAMRESVLKVIIVDDNRIVSKGIKSLINRKAGFIVVGEAENVNELSSLLKESQVNVVIVNMNISASEQEKIFSLLKNKYKVPFVCFGLNNSQNGVLGCIRSGASGILKRENSADQLFEAIQTVERGDQFLNGPVSRIS